MENDFDNEDKTWELQKKSTAKLESFQDGDKGSW